MKVGRIQRIIEKKTQKNYKQVLLAVEKSYFKEQFDYKKPILLKNQSIELILEWSE